MKSSPSRPLALSAGLLCLLPAALQAQHYVAGVEGLNAASVPPPGFYVRDYNYFYTADQDNDASGRSQGAFNAFVYANVPRLIWMSDTKFLGADVGVDALVPFVDQHVDTHGFNSTTFGLGDLSVNGILAWHPQAFDFVFCEGFWAPCGDSAAPPTTRAGQGSWADMLTAGGTWHIDAARTWAVSALSRYEFNFQDRDTHDTAGQTYTLEWGVGKTFSNKIDVGAAGYYQQQITANSGATSASVYKGVAAAGPEISGVIPWVEVDASLRVLYEFMAENRPQGEVIALTLTKRF
jgi:hypothetical protein